MLLNVIGYLSCVFKETEFLRKTKEDRFEEGSAYIINIWAEPCDQHLRHNHETKH